MAMIVLGVIIFILSCCCVIGAGVLYGYKELLLQVAHFDSTALTICLILVWLVLMALGFYVMIMGDMNKEEKCKF